MQSFGELYDALDATTSTNDKVGAMSAWFKAAAPADAAWALHFLTGAKLKRLIAPHLLAVWAVEHARVPPWLFEECQGVAGDLAETVALLLDTARGGARPLDGIPSLASLIEDRLLPLRDAPEEEKRAAVLALWDALPRREIFLLNKLLTGELRVGVSQTLAVRALAEHAGVEPAALAHRLMGAWQPSAAAFSALLLPEVGDLDLARPYPFFLASPLESPPEELGAREDFLAEWKWDGIRAQAVRRKGQSSLWSRGEELITARFPDLAAVWEALPDGTVLDGEVLAFAQGAPLPFAVLQQRIGRQKLGAKILADAPAAFMAYDLLEEAGADLRELPLRERRARLEALVGRVAGAAGIAASAPRLFLSAGISAPDWAALRALREGARARAVEGLMLKRWSSPYRGGRKRGDWWKYKIDPYSIDAVLVYAQPGSGRRATLMTDLTFAVWRDGELLPVAKAYSGLTDPELDELDRWIRQNTLERFGPVRHVKPVHVFELHFEGIARSARHKSGVAVRFPRIARWRQDKKPEEADTLESLQGLLTAPA